MKGFYKKDIYTKKANGTFTRFTEKLYSEQQLDLFDDIDQISGHRISGLDAKMSNTLTGRILNLMSVRLPDIWPNVRLTIGYSVKCPNGYRIFGHFSDLLLDIW